MVKDHHLREIPPHLPVPPGGARAPDAYCGSTVEERFLIIRDIMATTNPVLQSRRFNALWDLLLLSLELDRWQTRG